MKKNVWNYQKNNSDFKHVCEKYDLGFLKCASKINNGFSSHCYKLVTNKASYFIKVYQLNKLKIVTSAAKTEIYFQRGGVPVIARIRNLDGNDYLIINNKIFIVFPYVVIPKIHKWEKELYGELGNFLGKMHSYSIKVSNTNTFEGFDLNKLAAESLNTMSLLLEALRNKKRIRNPDILAANNLMIKINYLKDISFKKCTLPIVTLVHGDFHPGNLCIKNNKIEMIFDFDDCDTRSIYFELAKVIIRTCFNGSFDKAKFARTKCFLTEYQRHVKIKPSIFKKAIQICHFLHLNSYWVEEKWLEKPTPGLIEALRKERGALKYFVKLNNLNVFIRRVCAVN